MLNILSAQTHTTEAGLTMTSREIAELAGKNHADVLRDIRNMLEVLKKDASIFAGIYKDAYGRDKACFNLPKRETLILVSGYPEGQPHVIHDCGWISVRIKDS